MPEPAQDVDDEARGESLPGWAMVRRVLGKVLLTAAVGVRVLRRTTRVVAGR